MASHEQETHRPQLKRVLGRRDLVLLFVVAVFNLNVVPSIAVNGGITLWLWLVALALFFWPQGVAVIELSHRYPEEGGVYLWAKKECEAHYRAWDDTYSFFVGLFAAGKLGGGRFVARRD